MWVFPEERVKIDFLERLRWQLRQTAGEKTPGEEPYQRFI